jgi:signal transduction histidine kinase
MLDTAADGRTLPVEELQEYGRMIKQSGASIFRIVKNLMFWARLEMPVDVPSEPQMVQRSRERLNAENLQLWAETAATPFGRQKDIILEYTCPSEAVVEVVTPGLEFIVGHLLENAFKYSLPHTPVRISAGTDASRLLVVISDSGRGMSKEQVANVGMFKQFERQRLEQPGLGMGLMLATTFARKSGGDLELRSGEGAKKGLSVTLSLPLAPASRAPFPPASQG